LAQLHEPFTAEEATGAEQLAVVPPLRLMQDQFDGPSAENRLESSALEAETSTIVELRNLVFRAGCHKREEITPLKIAHGLV
jgi:hypothetical protein